MQTNGSVLLNQIKQLVSENANLKASLDAQIQLTALREKELLALKLSAAVNGNSLSNLENKELELEILQDYLDAQQHQNTGAANREQDLQLQLNKSICEHHQLQALQQQYFHLQTQFLDLQTQLEEAYKRIFLLQQQNSRIAEPWSFLEDNTRHQGIKK